MFTGSGVEVRSSDTIVGSAATINFGDNINVSSLSAGIVTVTGGVGVTWSVQGFCPKLELVSHN